MYDEKEEDRLEHVQIMKAKGKGPPKKSKVKIGMYIHCKLYVVVRGCLLMSACLQRRRRRVGNGNKAQVSECCVQYCESFFRLDDIASAIATHLLAFLGWGDTTSAYSIPNNV